MTSRTEDPTAPASDPAAAQRRVDAEPGAAPEGHSPAEALKNARAHLAELGEYIGHFVSAKADGVKVSLRNVGVYAVIGVIGLLAGMAFVVSAVVLVCVGIAGALTQLFGGRLWAGTLVTGIFFLAILAGGMVLGMKMLARASRERTVRKYATRQQQQRARFGTDVGHRAGNPAKPGQ